MSTVLIELIHPKAINLLRTLEELLLVRIIPTEKQSDQDEFPANGGDIIEQPIAKRKLQ
ncbi:hypothetical protein [Fibrella aquatilis]|uniref:Uncharacterized protein n=1 Tax=Fibrella aquatilis TaxID=2817059 RepID=A0A939K2J7_9BACT|nr:hypothetical protein [Fibrella aquatilis]MBO0934151.1 hypothetical protein [Fibrella aquatilis]